MLKFKHISFDLEDVFINLDFLVKSKNSRLNNV